MPAWPSAGEGQFALQIELYIALKEMSVAERQLQDGFRRATAHQPYSRCLM
jgi:hypothetical protein